MAASEVGYRPHNARKGEPCEAARYLMSETLSPTGVLIGDRPHPVRAILRKDPAILGGPVIGRLPEWLFPSWSTHRRAKRAS